MVEIRWRRMWSSLQDGQAGRGVESNENTQERTVKVGIRVEVMCSYLGAARGLDYEDSAERGLGLVSMVQR